MASRQELEKGWLAHDEAVLRSLQYRARLKEPGRKESVLRAAGGITAETATLQKSSRAHAEVKHEAGAGEWLNKQFAGQAREGYWPGELPWILRVVGSGVCIVVGLGLFWLGIYVLAAFYVGLGWSPLGVPAMWDPVIGSFLLAVGGVLAGFGMWAFGELSY